MTRGWMGTTLAAAALALAACGGDEESTSTSAATQTEEAAGALPDPITGEDAATIRIEDRLEQEIEIEGGPDRLADGFDSLWVKGDDGRVTRLDPASGKVISEVATDASQPVCQGLGVSEDAVWACPKEGEVVRIDPVAEAVSDEIKIDKVLDQGRLVEADGAIWVLAKEGSELTPIDSKTAKPGTPIPLGGPCTDLAASEDEIWVTCYSESRLLRVDIGEGEVADEVEMDLPRAIALGDALWVGFTDGVAQMDPDSLEVLAVYEASPGVGGAVFAGEDEVWVREEGGAFLVRIDPEEQAITERIEAPKLPSGGDVIVIGDSLWATAYDDQALVQLSLP